MRIIDPSKIEGVLLVGGQLLRPRPGTVPAFDSVTIGGLTGVLHVDDVDLGPVDVLRAAIVGYIGGLVEDPTTRIVPPVVPATVPTFRPDRDTQGTPVAAMPSF